MLEMEQYAAKILSFKKESWKITAILMQNGS